MNIRQQTYLIKQEAYRLGFSYIGIAKAERLNEESHRLDEWLSKGMHGKMSYMANHFEMRADPALLVPGARSVISLMYNYYTEKKQRDASAPKISMYAYGKDYHKVVKKKLKLLLKFIQHIIGEVNGRAFVDSAPVLEKAWAAKSGVGWMGKNTNIIRPQGGSYFFLAELILDSELDYDGPIKDYCGSCTACIDACPTDAIVMPYIVDGSKCISYFTIELKDEVLPQEMKGKLENWAFGCDICQQVCPWNRFSHPHREPEFEPSDQLLNMTRREWQEITEDVFEKLFRYSPLKRAKFKGLKRNIEFLKN
ncbi:MAG TPA: tRNA epoxyqueuosine(34) reductase QueG [Chitinophagales bacterium]|nr:tRNA epoxyqueuosine(34) reductase QueG [Chitinophagales bacterium]